MNETNKKPHVVLTRDDLGQFEPISSLSDERLDELISLSYVESISMGVSIFREGDVDNQTIYLLKGDIQLTSSSSGDEMIIHATTKEGKFPLDDSQPRQNSAVAMSMVEIVRIDNSVLDYMMMWDQLAVAEIANNPEPEKIPEPEKKSEKKNNDKVEKLVEQVVLDSIEDARQDGDIIPVSKSENTVDLTQTIKPELNSKKTKINKSEKSNKKETVDENSQTTVNEAIKVESKDTTDIKQEKKSSKNKTKKKVVENKSDTTINDAITTEDKKSEIKESEIKESEQESKPIENEAAENKENPIVYESRDWIRKIRQIMAFKNMPPANVKNLLEKMESLKVTKGDKIIEQGGVGDYYYIVTDGTAVVTRTIELATLTAGTSFGEEALVAKSPRNASVTMSSDGMLMRLSKKDFDELLIEPLMDRVSPDEARSKILQGAKWLDVRHAKEFHHSRLPGAINIPLHELRLRMTELDTETEYICCCRTGARSSSGSFLLAQNGFKVSLLTGGIQVMSQDLRR